MMNCSKKKEEEKKKIYDEEMMQLASSVSLLPSCEGNHANHKKKGRTSRLLSVN